MHRRFSPLLLLFVCLPAACPAGDDVTVTETADAVRVETDALAAVVRKRGYVSGIAAGSLLDKRTGATDLGFGLHVMDFLMAPGWRDDGYERDPALHGDLPKHLVEGPQLCTKAKELPVEIFRGDGFVALRLRHTFTEAGDGYDAGSTWEQTLLFRPGVRYVLTAERITSVNAVDDLFYRIDMPGHVRHGGDRGRTFDEIYLSHRDRTIPAAAFDEPFAPDDRFLYRRGDDRTGDAVPDRMIRAYRVRVNDAPGPWLAGMTLDPAAVSEAWCHQRGYVCFIQELHRRPVAAGETIGAAYVVGWFDDVAEMRRVYDEHRGTNGIRLDGRRFALTATP